MTQYEYDRNNNLVKTIDPELHESSQTYDGLGNIITKKDGNGNITTYSYNELNLLEKVVNVKGEATTFTYDLNGNMQWEKAIK